MTVVHGSGNLFRDFGDENPGLEQLRAELAAAVIRALDGRGLTVRAAAAETGVAAADFSRIRNVSLDRFTVDRLSRILWKLGQDMDFRLNHYPR